MPLILKNRNGPFTLPLFDTPGIAARTDYLVEGENELLVFLTAGKPDGSEDNGRTWSDPIIIRDDGGNWDIGYSRSVQRTDGKVVTVYYYWDEETGPERYIAYTIWGPNILNNN